MQGCRKIMSEPSSSAKKVLKKAHSIDNCITTIIKIIQPYAFKIGVQIMLKRKKSDEEEEVNAWDRSVWKAPKRRREANRSGDGRAQYVGSERPSFSEGAHGR